MPRLLVQLSDLHIKTPGSLAYGRVDTAACLRRAVAAVLRLRPAPQAVVVTGDLVDGGQADEYAHLRALLQPLRCPVYLMPGNHDERQALRRAFPDHRWLQADAAGDFIEYAIDLGGLRLVTVDTVVPRAEHGEVCARRIARLDACLRADTRTPTVVALHHPPFRTSIAHMDRIGLLQGAEALAEVVARHPQVRRVICGHLHRRIQAVWAGTLAMTAPSTAHQVALGLAPDAPAAFTLEPPGLLLHAWSDAGELVSHDLAPGEFDAYPFDADDTPTD